MSLGDQLWKETWKCRLGSVVLSVEGRLRI